MQIFLVLDSNSMYTLKGRIQGFPYTIQYCRLFHKFEDMVEFTVVNVYCSSLMYAMESR